MNEDNGVELLVEETGVAIVVVVEVVVVTVGRIELLTEEVVVVVVLVVLVAPSSECFSDDRPATSFKEFSEAPVTTTEGTFTSASCRCCSVCGS